MALHFSSSIQTERSTHRSAIMAWFAPFTRPPKCPATTVVSAMWPHATSLCSRMEKFWLPGRLWNSTISLQWLDTIPTAVWIRHSTLTAAFRRRLEMGGATQRAWLCRAMESSSSAGIFWQTPAAVMTSPWQGTTRTAAWTRHSTAMARLFSISAVQTISSTM